MIYTGDYPRCAYLIGRGRAHPEQCRSHGVVMLRGKKFCRVHALRELDKPR